MKNYNELYSEIYEPVYGKDVNKIKLLMLIHFPKSKGQLVRLKIDELEQWIKILKENLK